MGVKEQRSLKVVLPKEVVLVIPSFNRLFWLRCRKTLGSCLYRKLQHQTSNLRSINSLPLTIPVLMVRYLKDHLMESSTDVVGGFSNRFSTLLVTVKLRTYWYTSSRRWVDTTYVSCLYNLDTTVVLIILYIS